MAGSRRPLPLRSLSSTGERGAFVRLLLTVIAALLYAIGWVAGVVSLLVVWCFTALAVGWDDARTLRAPERQQEPVRAR